MHCELVIPGLFADQPDTRLPAIELLLARGRRSSSSSGSQRLQSWLHGAFELGAQPQAAGALTLLGANGDPGGECWARADPVHFRLMRDRLILVPGQALGVTRDEAQALCEALDRHFTGRIHLEAVDPLRWCAKLAEEVTLGADCPLEDAGRDVDLCLPADRSASPAQQLMNEAQMLLHGHPVNEAREARGEPAVNSLWLWGAGRLPRVPACRWQSVSAEEPVALGLARVAGVRHRGLPASAAAWLDRAPEEGRHLIVLDRLRVPLALSHAAEYREGLAALERDWFAPLLTALREGRIGMVTVHVPDAADCVAYETIRGDLRRFWRRPKALEHYA
jgi:hypothetical protein